MDGSIPAPPASYEYAAYPRWRYHPDGRAVVVQNREEEARLGAGWRDRPVRPSLFDRVRQALAGGPVTLPELAEALGTPVEEMDTFVRRYPQVFARTTVIALVAGAPERTP
jgi:hypothetical protein